jgi:hypothetical protein
MLTEAEYLARLLPGEATLDDVRVAFSWTHPGEPKYSWKAGVRCNVSGEIIDINGKIYCDSIEIGEFERRLCYQKGFRCAKHIKIEIAKAHQGKHIATYHYRRAIAFYRLLGYRYVYLDADVDGPAVWPQFGFDLARPNEKTRLLARMRRLEARGLPSDAAQLFAPDIAAIEDPNAPKGSEPLGFRLLKELRERSGGPLAMVLDLENERQLALLP